MNVEEFGAGPEQLFVVYEPDDTGDEVDPAAIFAEIARDAARRAGEGYWIVSTLAIPARHAAVAFGREGSGFTTKVSVTVLYSHLRTDAAPRAGGEASV